jgi:hypothetical protein
MPLKIAIRVRRFDWPAVAYHFLFDIFAIVCQSKIMRYQDFRALTVVPNVQATTVSLCKTLNWILGCV